MRKHLPLGAVSGEGDNGIEWYVAEQGGTLVAHFELEGDDSTLVLVDDLDSGWMPEKHHVHETIQRIDDLINHLVDFLEELRCQR